MNKTLQIVIGLAVVGGVGYFIYTKFKASKSASTATNTQVPRNPAGAIDNGLAGNITTGISTAGTVVTGLGNLYGAVSTLFGGSNTTPVNGGISPGDNTPGIGVDPMNGAG